MSPITIIICTINPLKCVRLLNSLLKYTADDEVIVILDGIEYDQTELISTYMKEHQNFTLITNPSNQGLSYSRNLGMEQTRNNYVIFFDDDVVLRSNVIDKYRQLFERGHSLIGGPLCLPASYPPLPSWFPYSYSSLLGIHTNQTKIWGANFGFNVRKAIRHNLQFAQPLGRRGGNLASGDDTSFVNEYSRLCGEEGYFTLDISVDHYIDNRRYSIKYLSKRAFWQGKSEVRRKSITAGIKKEFVRAFSVGNGTVQNLVQLFGGALLFFCFLVGLVAELCLCNYTNKIGKKYET